MDTCSEIVFVCKGYVNDLIQKEIEANENLSNLLNFADIKVTKEENQEKVFLYHWASIKWFENYNEYSELSFINVLVKQHEEDCYLVELVESEELISGCYHNNPFNVRIERFVCFDAF